MASSSLSLLCESENVDIGGTAHFTRAVTLNNECCFSYFYSANLVCDEQELDSLVSLLQPHTYVTSNVSVIFFSSVTTPLTVRLPLPFAMRTLLAISMHLTVAPAD